MLCSDFQAAAATTFTVSGVTFHLETSIDATDAPDLGGPQAIELQGPDPFQPFGPANPARLAGTTLDACAAATPASPAPSTLPDTSVELLAGLASAPALAALALMLLIGSSFALASARIRGR